MIVASWLRASVTLNDSVVLMDKVYRHAPLCTTACCLQWDDRGQRAWRVALIRRSRLGAIERWWEPGARHLRGLHPQLESGTVGACAENNPDAPRSDFV